MRPESVPQRSSGLADRGSDANAVVDVRAGQPRQLPAARARSPCCFSLASAHVSCRLKSRLAQRRLHRMPSSPPSYGVRRGPDRLALRLADRRIVSFMCWSARLAVTYYPTKRRWQTLLLPSSGDGRQASKPTASLSKPIRCVESHRSKAAASHRPLLAQYPCSSRLPM